MPVSPPVPDAAPALLLAILRAASPAVPATPAAAREALLRRQLLALFGPGPTGQPLPQKLS